MSYENSAGLGVGANYGTRELGGSGGKMRTSGKEVQVTFEFGFGNMDWPYEVALPKGARVIGADLEVQEVFAAGSAVPVGINGGTAISANLAVAGSSAIDVATLANNPVTTADWILKATPDAEALASAIGRASLVITYIKL